MYPDPWHKETMFSHLTHSHNLRVNQSKWNLFHLLNIYIMNQRRKRYMRVAFVCLFCSMSVDRPPPRVNFWRCLSDMGWWYIIYKMENSPQCVLVILADDIGVLHSFRNIKMVLCSDYIYILHCCNTNRIHKDTHQHVLSDVWYYLHGDAHAYQF